MTEAAGAIFLSYASQDAGVAARIGAALREAGLEVWFDQSELRGGDAWDQLIRRRIRECALFVPVISSHTQSRLEGYFRLEWKLAIERTHLMADPGAGVFSGRAMDLPAGRYGYAGLYQPCRSTVIGLVGSCHAATGGHSCAQAGARHGYPIRLGQASHAHSARGGDSRGGGAARRTLHA